ncbi:hypothetical protein EJB05_17385 [Eragrostis curvula]|uniref:Uncharacterized protein n=1 Tax=Eragrostis curvula TaxID=38414 RepID=A0A5J9VH79_9POAL|nr:hypothetical protein EJB05_17385 [Eragrostis curvula]
MGRAPCCDKGSVKRGPWSPEEDELLRSYVRNHGTGGNWIALPHKAEPMRLHAPVAGVRLVRRHHRERRRRRVQLRGHQQAPPLARYVDAAMPAPPHQQQQHAPTSLAEFSAAGVANNGGWVTGGGMALEDMFLPELLGAGEFPSSGDLVFGASGFGPLLLQDRAASASLQELSACYFPNAQAEMWAAAADIKPPTGLCHGLT